MTHSAIREHNCKVKPDATAERKRSTTLRVLVVDDEKAIRESLAAILRMNKYEVEAAADGVEGFELARTFRPDAVISDVVMPNRNGVDMAMLIAEHMPEVKVILISGQAATKELLETAQSRGHDFECLAKPIHPTELLKRLAESLADTPPQAQTST